MLNMSNNEISRKVSRILRSWRFAQRDWVLKRIEEWLEFTQSRYSLEEYLEEELNIKKCQDCGRYEYIDDGLYDDGEFFCRDCREYCECCNRIYPTSELNYCEDVQECRCEDCSGWCERCECYVGNTDNMRSVYTDLCQSNVERWCSCCVDNDAFYCDGCNNYYSDDVEHDYYECNCYCQECYDSIDKPGNYVWSYHARPTQKFFLGQGKIKDSCNVTDKEMAQCIGTELEVEQGDNDADETAEQVAYLIDWDNNQIYFNEDGSLGGKSFEMITQPHTVKEWYKLPWEEITKVCKENGYRSHDGGHCGFHIHVNRKMFGNTTAKQNLAISKVYMFFDAFWEDILKVSRREPNVLHYCAKNSTIDRECGDKAKIKTARKYVNSGDGSHYEALNNRNTHTFEYRLGRGTLNVESLFAWFDFVITVTRNSKRVSYKNYKDLDMWFKGLKPETIAYMEKRKAFTEWIKSLEVKGVIVA